MTILAYSFLACFNFVFIEGLITTISLSCFYGWLFTRTILVISLGQANNKIHTLYGLVLM